MASADYTPSASFPAPNSSSGAPASAAAHASTLQSNLQKLASRRNAILMWRAIAASLSVGAGVAVVMILAYRFYLVDGPFWLPIIPLLISIVIGWRLGTLARGSTFAAALEADEKLNLKERLSSALAFASPDAVSRVSAAPAESGVLSRVRAAFSPRLVTQNRAPVASTVLVPSLVEDAATRSQKIDPKNLYPLRFDRTHRVLLLALAMLLIAVLMPNVPWLLSAAEKTQRKNIAQQGEGLVEVAKEIKKDEPKEAKESAESKRLAKKMEALGHKMMRGRMAKKEALTSLGELKKDLEKASQNNDGSNESSGSMQNMQQALDQLADQPMQSEVGEKLKEAAKNRDAEAAAKAMEKLADKIEKGEMSAEEKQKAANDLQKMADQLKKQGGGENEQMAQQLEQAAQALKQQAQQEQPQQQQGQQGQKPAQQGDGKNQQGQQKQGQQEQGQQSQSQQGQGKQGQQKQGQKQNGSQQSQGGGQQQGQQQGNNQGMSNSLRQMAKSLRQGGSGSNSQGLQRMLNKIREAERDTGMGNSGQSGSQFKNGKMGGNCPGGDCNGGMIPGKDLKANDPHGPVGGGAGLGPRNNATGSKSGGGVSKDKSKRTGDKRRWEDVWSDRLPATRKKIDRVQGQYQDDGEMEQLPTKTEAKGGPVKTPYYEVYESYQKDAEDAVGKETVPPAYKQPVKDYFESIKPN